MLELEKNINADGALVISMRGAATIEQAEALRQTLLEGMQQAAEQQQAIRINCGQVTEIDSFILQMLCSAHRTAISRRVLLTWDSPPPPPVKALIRSAGFVRHAGCTICPDDQHCMWCDK